MKRAFLFVPAVALFSFALCQCVADQDPVGSSTTDAGNPDGSVDGNVGDGGLPGDANVPPPATGKFLWVKSWNVVGGGIATDSANDTFVTFLFEGSTQIDSFALTGIVGHTYIGLAKIKPDGSVAFAKFYDGGGVMGASTGVAIGSDGAIYLSGYLQSTTVDFGNGVTVVGPASGQFYGFLTKLDATGTGVWARTMTSPQSTMNPFAFDPNVSRGCYPAVTGNTVAFACPFDGVSFAYGLPDGGGATFANNQDTNIPTSGRVANSHAYIDYAIAAFDTASGAFKWGDGIGTVAASSGDQGDLLHSLASDPSGGFVLAGAIGGVDNATVTDSLGHVSVTRVGMVNGQQGFEVRLNAADGTATFNQIIGDSQSGSKQEDFSGATDPSGASTVVAGEFVQNANIGGNELTSTGLTTGYCVRVSTTTRAPQFTALVTGDGYDVANAIASDNSGNTICIGQATSNTKIAGTAISSPPGNGLGMFAAKFASDGGVLWAKGVAGISDTDVAYPLYLALTPNGETRIAGSWGGSLPFDGFTQMANDSGSTSTFVAAYAP